MTQIGIYIVKKYPLFSSRLPLLVARCIVCEHGSIPDYLMSLDVNVQPNHTYNCNGYTQIYLNHEGESGVHCYVQNYRKEVHN